MKDSAVERRSGVHRRKVAVARSVEQERRNKSERRGGSGRKPGWGSSLTGRVLKLTDQEHAFLQELKKKEKRSINSLIREMLWAGAVATGRIKNAAEVLRSAAIFMVVVLSIGKLAGNGITFPPADQNIAAEHTELSRFFDDLSKAPPQGLSNREARASVAASAPQGSVRGLNWSQAGGTPFKENSTLDAMTEVSMIAAQAIGTASQDQQSANLSNYGSQLAGSSDPKLAQAGGLMQQEAAAVNMGDSASAQSFASSLQSIPRADTSGLSASGSDQSWGTAMQGVGQQALASAASSFSGAAMNALVSSLGSYFGGSSASTGSSSSGFWASMASNFASSMAKGAVNGNNTPNSTAGGLGGIANSGGGALGSSAAGGLFGKGAIGSTVGGIGAPATGASGIGSGIVAPGGAASIAVQPGQGIVQGGALPASGQ